MREVSILYEWKYQVCGGVGNLRTVVGGCGGGELARVEGWHVRMFVKCVGSLAGGSVRVQQRVDLSV